MTTVNVLTFVKATGQIVLALQCSDSDVALQGQQPGYAAIKVDAIPPMEGTTVTKHYVDPIALVVKSRPVFSPAITASKLLALANSTDKVTLANVPAGAGITIAGPKTRLSATGDGTAIELTFAYPGDYQITVSKFPILDFEATIHAT